MLHLFFLVIETESTNYEGIKWVYFVTGH